MTPEIIKTDTLVVGAGQAGVAMSEHLSKLGVPHLVLERSRNADDLELPASLDYAAVRALSFEARQILARHRPETIGQAARLPGVTPAAISLLLVHLKKLRRSEAAANDGGALRANA